MIPAIGGVPKSPSWKARQLDNIPTVELLLSARHLGGKVVPSISDFTLKVCTSSTELPVLAETDCPWICGQPVARRSRRRS